jgi:hypothetical protein
VRGGREWLNLHQKCLPEAYLAAKPVPNLVSRPLKGTPAPAPYALSVPPRKFTVTVYVIGLMALVFNVGFAEIAGFVFLRNHHKKLLNGQ